MKVTHAILGELHKVQVVDSRPDDAQRARIRDNAPHSHYALEREDIHMELEAFRTVCDGIGVHRNWSVCEPFGGSGWHSVFIQAMIQPHRHRVNDIAPDCVESMRRTLPEDGVQITRGDGYALLHQPLRGRWSWVHADFNMWTLKRMAEDHGLRAAWLGAFSKASHCITFTDTTPYIIPNDQGTGAWYSELGRWLVAFTDWRLHRTVDWGPAAMHVLRPVQEVYGDSVKVQHVIQPMTVTITGEVKEA